MKSKLNLILAGLVASSMTATADTLITSVDQDGATTRIYVSAGKTGAVNENGQTDFIYDGNKGEMVALNHEEKGYLQMDEQAMAKMASGLNQMQQQMMSMMQEQMADMSPEEREQMRQMMGSMMPGMDNKKEALRIDETGKSDKVNEHSCKWVSVYNDKTLLSEACVVTLSNLDIDKDDFETLSAFLNKMSQFAGQFGAQDEMMLNQHLFANKLLPVQIREHGEEGAQTTTLSFKKQAVSANIFQIPAGYTLQQMPAMPEY